MGVITVTCHCPESASVRIFIDGEERDTVLAEPGQKVHVKIEQVLKQGRPEGGELVKAYLGCVFTGHEIRYDSEIPSPFQAVYEGDFQARQENVCLSFTLISQNGHYAILKDEGTIAGNTELSYENNTDSGIWKILFAMVIIPLTVVYAAGMAALFIGGNVPASAAIIFGTLYSLVYLFVMISFILKVRKVRKLQ